MIRTEAIRRWYKRRGYQRLADAAADVGCSVPLLSKLLNGRVQSVRRDTAELFARRELPLEVFGFSSGSGRRA